MTFKNHVRRLCAELRTAFFLGEYTMDLTWSEENKEKGGGTVAADIRTDLRYLNFGITIYPMMEKFYRDKQYFRIYECLVHEFSHVLTDPLYKIAIESVSNDGAEFLEDIRERQTQRITNIIIKGIKLKYMPYKKPMKKVVKKAEKKVMKKKVETRSNARKRKMTKRRTA